MKIMKLYNSDDILRLPEFITNNPYQVVVGFIK